MTSRADQIAKDNALVALENRKSIRKCNMRIDPRMKRPKETTYQVVLDALALTTCYPSFLVTADVPVIYMHQFWDTVNKHGSSYRFKIDNKKFAVNVVEFREILNICPRIPSQEFSDPPYEEEALSFVKHLGHTGDIKHLTDITVDHLYQPWRAFAAIINKCLSGKEDLAYQIENKEEKKSDKMYYPRFTKKNPSILMRNRMFMHTAREDTILGIMKFISKHEDVQVYGVLMPKEMTNPEMLSSESFQTYYAIVTGAEPPKSAKVSSVGSKKKATAKADTGKGLKVLSEVSLSKEAQLKEVLERSKQDFHISQASGSSDGTDEETGTKPGVPDVPKQDSESETESWGDSDEDDNDEEEAYDNDDDDNADDDDGNSDADDSNDDNDDDDNNDDDENVDDEEKQEEEKEENADERVPTPEDMDFSNKKDDEEKNEEEEDDYEMLYRDVNVNLQQEDVDMTNANQGGAQDSDLQYKDAHVTLTASQKTLQVPALIDEHLTTRLGYAVQTAFKSYKVEFEKEAQAEQERFIEIIDKSVKEMVKDETEMKKTRVKTPPLDQTKGKRRKTDKDAESSKEPKSKRSKSSSSSKGTLRFPHKSTGKSVHTKEPRHGSGMPHVQEFNTGNNEDQPAVEATKDDWFMKPNKPPTPDHEWNKR
ncbi:hypothetical protein Tco_0772567 [Tanacetum coccineum]|uniref:Uncharacterized protein n=1 Tax=Tanacetum coccineum TaxID=301880 RepID=A0ABQ4ZJL6_9ASTR